MPRDAELIVIHSGVAHRLAAGDGGYNQRRAECEQACAKFGVSQLRDLSVENLPEIENLPEPLNRRARHVITENERVLHAVEAMKANHLPELGLLFYASHASMRDDYQVSVPEIDLLVDLAREEANVFGARLTGGGFGGSVVMLARAGCGRAAAERIARNYEQRSTCKARILVPAK